MKGDSRGGQLIGTSPSGGSRLVVDVMSYRKRRAGRTSVCHGHLPPIRELGCYVDLNRSFYEVPRLDVEQNFRWELIAQSVDVIYLHGVRWSHRMVVDVMSYKQRRGGRTVIPFIC